MTETPREYKKRIDETRAQKRKNRDQLIQELENYELVDEKYKARTKQEILSNFEKNEKAEKNGELYIKIGKELQSLEIKYKELEELKEKLKSKNHEKSELKDQIIGQFIDGKDETTLKIQMNNVKKLHTKLEGIEKEVEELVKEIENREQELKEIEETYGKKADVVISSPTESSKGKKSGNNNKIHSSTRAKEKFPKTLEEYKEKVLEKKGKLEQSRGDIIKLLDEGIGIDENLKEKIKGEITEVFDEYNDKQEGSLRMKSARYMENRERILINIGKGKYNERESQSLCGKQLIKGKKANGKQYIIWGRQKIGDDLDSISLLQEIGGKPCFLAEKDGKLCVMRGNEQIGDWYDHIYYIQSIRGKPCVDACIDRKSCVMRGKEQYSGWFDSISFLQEIGGKPCFLAEKDGKLCVMRGKEQYSGWFDRISSLQEIGGKPAYIVKNKHEEYVMRGKKRYSSEKYRYIWDLEGIGGKPAYKANNDYRSNSCQTFRGETEIIRYKKYKIGGKPCFNVETNGNVNVIRGGKIIKSGHNYVIRGDKIIGPFSDIRNDIIEVGGKPYFIAKDNGKYYVMQGKEKYSEDFDDVGWHLIVIGGKPAFWAKKDGKWCVMRGCEQQGDWFDVIWDPVEIGGKPAFEVKKDGKYSLMRGNEQQGGWFDNIGKLQEIGGKPCFEVSKDYKECIMRGDKELGGLFFRVGEIKESGGKPIFKATKKGKSCVFRGDKQYTGYYDHIREIYTDIGKKPLIKVGVDGGECIIQGNEKQSEIYRGIRQIKNIGGKLAFVASDNSYKKWVMRGGEQQGDCFDEIWEIQEIGGKPVFIAKKDGKECVIRGNEQIGEWYEKIYGLQEAGGKPVFIAKREDGKSCIIRGNEQYSDWFDDIKNLIKIGGKLAFIVENKGVNYVVRGEKQYGKKYKYIFRLRELGGKPTFDVATKLKDLYTIRGNVKYSDWIEKKDHYREIGGKPTFITRKKGKECVIRGNKQLGDWMDDILNLYNIGGEPVFIAKKDGKKCIMWGNRQVSDRYDEINVKEPEDIEMGSLTFSATKNGKTKIITLYKKMNFKPKNNTKAEVTKKPEGEDEQLDTQRGVREKLMHKRYEKILNLNELLFYIKNNKLLDDEAFKQLEEKAIESYYENYKKAKEDKDFQVADNEYRKLKSLKRKYKKLNHELTTKEGEDKENLETVDKRIYEIADEIEDIGGSFFKRNKLNKIKEERDKLEARRKNIIILQAEEYKLRNEVKKQEKLYGPKINSDKLRGKSEEELKKHLKKGELTQVKTLKEYKEKQAGIRENTEKLITFIKQLDLGIDEKIKGEILKIIEDNLKASTKTKEGKNLLAMLNNTEKYLKENLNDFIKKLRGIKSKIQKCEEQVKILEGKKATASYEELLKINDKIYEIKQGEIEIKNEYDETKKTINELLNKYDGSDIESML